MSRRGGGLLADSVAAIACATYSAQLGFIGGNQFRDALWQPLLIGRGVALALGAIAETLARFQTAACAAP